MVLITIDPEFPVKLIAITAAERNSLISNQYHSSFDGPDFVKRYDEGLMDSAE